MAGEFWNHMGVMTLTFGAFLLPALASRRMDRSDYVTLVVIVLITFVAVVVPGIVMFGFDQNSGTYVLAALIVITVATLNRRFTSRPTN